MIYFMFCLGFTVKSTFAKCKIMTMSVVNYFIDDYYEVSKKKRNSGCNDSTKNLLLGNHVRDCNQSYIVLDWHRLFEKIILFKLFQAYKLLIAYISKF